MAFAEGLAGQLARPEGPWGRLLGGAMDIANRVPTRMALDLLDPREGERILDAGCGTGAAIEGMLARAPVRPVGVDPSATMIDAAARRLHGRARLACATVEAAPLEEGSFDAALMLNVLYFADPLGRMVSAVHRALRPGGRLVAYVTHAETMERWRFARAGRHRLFDAPDLANLLAAGGFARQRMEIRDVRVARGVRGLLVKAVR